ncbi:MAG: DJ-1/PfpI family protein [Leptonema sp. (in: Bacteria)]|nr:DJ-1/PfpI family protein [Leptonema sp. (in: bacteria)]
MKRVLVPLAEGFEEIEAITIINILRRAGVEVVTAGLNDGPITAARRTRHIADTTIDHVLDQDFDLIALPGGSTGAANLAADQSLVTLLKKMKSKSKPLAAICAAPNVLLQHGILEPSDSFTLYPGTMAESYQKSYSNYQPEKRVVTSNQITTGKGPGVSVEFALSLVEQLVGKEKSDKIRSDMFVG